MPWLRQLPRWAWFGAGVLAFIAGLINAVAYLGLRHEPISNMTGNTSLLGAAPGQADGGETVHWVFAIAAFVLGAMLSGMIVQQSTLKLHGATAWCWRWNRCCSLLPFRFRAHPIRSGCIWHQPPWASRTAWSAPTAAR
jgi:hypothetical protein